MGRGAELRALGDGNTVINGGVGGELSGASVIGFGVTGDGVRGAKVIIGLVVVLKVLRDGLMFERVAKSLDRTMLILLIVVLKCGSC